MRHPGITKKPTVLVPSEHRREIMKLSKAALADVAWSLAGRIDELYAMNIFREEWAVVQTYRE